MNNEIFDHLARIAAGEPSREDERRADAVDTLVQLTRNLPAESNHDNAAVELAQLITRMEL